MIFCWSPISFSLIYLFFFYQSVYLIIYLSIHICLVKIIARYVRWIPTVYIILLYLCVSISLNLFFFIPLLSRLFVTHAEVTIKYHKNIRNIHPFKLYEDFQKSHIPCSLLSSRLSKITQQEYLWLNSNK